MKSSALTPVFPVTTDESCTTRRHFRFTMIPNEYTGSAQLKILLEPPDNETPEPVVYKFDYDGIEWPISDYVYRSGNQHFVYLPELQPNKLVEFSLGLENTSFANYRVFAVLTTDNGQTIVQGAELECWLYECRWQAANRPDTEIRGMFQRATTMNNLTRKKCS